MSRRVLRRETLIALRARREALDVAGAVAHPRPRSFECPGCGQYVPLKYVDELGKLECPTCDRVFQVPAALRDLQVEGLCRGQPQVVRDVDPDWPDDQMIPLSGWSAVATAIYVTAAFMAAAALVVSASVYWGR